MKKYFFPDKNKICRFALKLGSALFLLFFMLFAPAAPIIAQLGSAAFIFLVMCLAPMSPEAQISAPEPPTRSDAVYSQIDENTLAVEIAISRSQRQQYSPQITSAGQSDLLEKRLFLQKKTSLPKLFEQTIKPEKWRCCCQPVRAGPFVGLV